MSQTQNFEFKGLVTFPSDLGLPPGSLAIARNINLSRPNLVEPRRGFDILANLPSGSDRGDKLFFYSNSLLVHYGTLLALYSGGSFLSRGTISAPSNATSIRSAALNQNLYFTSSAGIQKMDATGNNIYPSGVANALNASLALVNGKNLAVPSTSDVTYRWCLVRQDANKNPVRGGVSPRCTINNSAGTARDVSLRCYLPAGVDATYYAEIYRTKSAGAGLTDDVEQLVITHSITAGEATNGYFDELDVTPDALVLGATIYTASTQQGILKNSAIPPLARDVAEFKQVAFYADCEGVHRYTFTLLACGTGSTKQLDVGDTITIGTEVYTAAVAENVGTKNFLIDVASASPATRIATTISSLMNVINGGSAIVYATIETTTANDLPGTITLYGRTLGASAFTVVSSRSQAFNPTLTTPVGVNQTSTNSIYKNGLMYSKKGEPEAVPLINVFYVGSSDDRIKRIIPLKDSLLIFKEKEGIYRLTGENEGSFSISLLDSSAKLVSPDSLVVLNGYCYGLFEAGVCEVSDTSVNIISQPVSDKLLTRFGSALAAVKAYTFGIGYETDRKYFLCIPSNSSDTSSNYQLVYDVDSGFWAEWDLSARAGGVNPADGLLYYAAGDSARIRPERKTYDFTDFADFEQLSTLTSAVSTTLTLSGTSTMSVGDLLNQGSLIPAYIVSVNSAAGTVVVDLDQTWDTGSPVQHFKGIDVELEWNREVSGNPAGFKHYCEALFAFKRNFIGNANFKFSSDTNPGVNTIVKAGQTSQNAWGYGAWDDGVWGGESSPAPVRLGVPNTSARCNSLSVNFSQRIAFSDFQLSGISLIFTPSSVRTSR